MSNAKNNFKTIDFFYKENYNSQYNMSFEFQRLLHTFYS